MSSQIDFRQAFEALTEHPPFPWQVAMYEKFIDGAFSELETCSLPTGLGKTSIIAVWLIALAERSDVLPRRLVYVVNRRTVVDQTTDEVLKLRNNLKKCSEVESALRKLCAIGDRHGEQDNVPLAISTLRGQFADNQEWSSDPARPAVICGTVDMIGSRLLFGGYRCGFKSRPLHAGFLGQDALLVHDEAHLEPAFQRVIETVREEQQREPSLFGDRHRLRVIELSATARGQSDPFELSDADLKHSVVKERIEAVKRLELHPLEDEKKELVAAIAERALEYEESDRAVLIFLRSVESVEKVADALRKHDRKRTWVETLTGTLRGKERDELVETPIFARFLPEGNRPKDIELPDGTVYLVCTSAGEVGVNISADDLVCDLSTFDSMAQRFGRVNRFGKRDDTQIDVFHPVEFPTEEDVAAELAKPRDKQKGLVLVDDRRRLTLRLLERLRGDVSPQSLSTQLDSKDCLAAFSPDPEYVDTSDILFDAWALTTIKGELPGRPALADFLHGIAEWQPSTTEVAWREEVGELSPALLEQNKLTAEELLGAYPVKPHETLRDRTDRVFKHLEKIAQREPKQESGPGWQVWCVDRERAVTIHPLSDLVDSYKRKRPLVEPSDCLILLPPEAGGLQKGLLNGTSKDRADDVSSEWFADEDQTVKRRDRSWDEQAPQEDMRLIVTIDTKPDADALPEEEQSGRRLWKWHVRPASADDDGSRSAREPITWQHHTDDVVNNMRLIADQLLSDHSDLHAALMLAAKCHDLGKRREVWQRSIGNPEPTVWFAKSGKGEKWGRLTQLTRYRHEFGSLFDMLDEEGPYRVEFDQISEEMQDVVLHTIAVHHGYGRPHFATDRAFDPHQSEEAWEKLAIEVPRRYARLQRRYGRWGLAYLESLLRAADASASAHPTPAPEKSEVSV